MRVVPHAAKVSKELGSRVIRQSARGCAVASVPLISRVVPTDKRREDRWLLSFS